MAASRRRTSTRTRQSPQRNNPVLAFDIIGVALVSCCPIILFSLIAPHSSGVVGGAVAAAIRVTFGMGAFVIPFLAALVGAMFIVGPTNVIPRNLSVGGVILFVSFVSIGSLATGVHSAVPGAGGGYIGNSIGFLLAEAIGATGAYITLCTAALVAVVIMVDVPISVVLTRLHERLRGVKPRGGSALKPAQTDAVPDALKPPRLKTPSVFQRIIGRDGASHESPTIKLQELASKPEVRINGILNARPEKAAKVEQISSTGDDLSIPDQGEYQLPPTSLLDEPQPPPHRVESELRDNIAIIERTLEEFKVTATVVEIACGPTVARYEIQLAPGIKVNKIIGLADNLAMQLAAIDVRVEAPIPGKAAIGVEVPNKNRSLVGLREIVESSALRDHKSKLAFALGKDVAGNPAVADIAQMPHMLIGGATAAGKSVCLSTLISSLLCRATPDELKMVLIDPKRVELTAFNDIPHLACPVVKDVKVAAGILRAVVQEMENRYELFSRCGAKNLDVYNAKVPKEDAMPYMVVVVDELCDLMMQCGPDVEGSITRIAQLARATGIHLIIATQRPSVDVITGIIKANISSRIAFSVSSHHDSRTILDQKGAERLIGRGDMLFLPIDASKPTRIQGSYISEAEVTRLVDFIKSQRGPVYTLTPSSTGGDGGFSGDDSEAFADEFFEPSVRFVTSTGYCSTSMLQRKFKIGYTRAARIVDAMEVQGIVGALDGAKPRQVLIAKGQVESVLGGQAGLSYGNADDDGYVPAPIEDDEEE